MNILDLFQKGPSSNIEPPYIIAEAGVNHEGSMELAKRLIDEAKEGGANAIKFQTYKAETLASKNSPAYWDTSKEPTTSQFKLFKKYDKFWKDEFETLKNYCDTCGIEFLSTPFDEESAAFLNDLMPVFKVSSSDITNRPFIEYICDFGKPIILSTGASELHEIEEAVSWIDKAGIKVSLLHCVLNYPTEHDNAHLGMIRGLRKKFPDRIIGYSDHTLPEDMRVLQIANLLGAEIIEKHFTHDKTLRGNDHYHAMDKEDLKKFRSESARNHILLGNFKVRALPSEKKSRDNARRSLVAKRDILKGRVISKKDLTYKRPGSGVSPKAIGEIVGKKARQNIKEDAIITWSLIE